ncbi:MAG: coproporphyrinogen-III oxidase family protein, partial [Planctomycetota bacterium]|nr:coproporphyrinogen-III oxidase family protein [Planctomycetota bacterium]
MWASPVKESARSNKKPCASSTESWERTSPRPPGTPLYLHIPFCQTLCPYCDFYSVLGAGRDPAALVDALLAEARLHAPPAPSTVYLGGGTPTFLPPGELSRLLDGLDKQTGFRSSASEVSAECNPESLSQETAAALVAGGVTRLSLGIQSLRDETLTFLGRPHNRDQALAAYDIARAAQPRSLGLDLIYAVPGLSTEAWRADLATALGLGPDHLSAYALTWEEGTGTFEDEGTDAVSPPGGNGPAGPPPGG